MQDESAIALVNHRIYKLNHSVFFNFFGVPLREFWHPLFGFDVIRFDKEFLIPKLNYNEDQESIKAVVIRIYGDNAARLIDALLV